MWLRDPAFLHSRVPNARILTFGYDADTLKFSGVSRLTLADHAISLIDELILLRQSSRVGNTSRQDFCDSNLSTSIARRNADLLFSSPIASVVLL